MRVGLSYIKIDYDSLIKKFRIISLFKMKHDRNTRFGLRVRPRGIQQKPDPAHMVPGPDTVIEKFKIHFLGGARGWGGWGTQRIYIFISGSFPKVLVHCKL